MPASVRYLLLLVGCAFAVGVLSIIVQHHQTTHRGKVVAEQLTGGNVRAGKSAILRYGCGSCHQIPGVPGANGRVGPSLESVAARAEIAGRLPNNPANLVHWICHPQQVSPGNGMPDLHVSEQDGRDIATYLYTLR